MHLRPLLACCLILTGAVAASADESVLPRGNAREALSAPHFPDRVHEFVFRNWNVVEPSRLARILDCSENDVLKLARSMGLPEAARVPGLFGERGYITLIRRNWHLLPYEQLLDLVGMTVERLAFALREDDFLWVKLGSLKPRCDKLRYRPPDASARLREGEIRRVLERDFGRELRRPAEPRFDFVRQLSTLPARTPGHTASPKLPLRIVYSYLAVYGDPLSNARLDPYPDGLLQRCSDAGINGVWLHVVLRDLAPGGTTFPEFGSGSELRLSTLRSLVQRASRYGIGVYLYLNEPRAMPESFFSGRPELAGVRENQFAALCTSQPAVRAWISDAIAHVFSRVPGLAGVFTMTASENLTNCASHGHWKDCPRCKDRTDGEIIAEVNAAIEAGVHRASPGADVLVSDWGWRGHGAAADIVANLPKSAWLMSVSEWEKTIERGGVQTRVGEYSISAVGPGPRAVAHWAAARERGLKTVAEVQFNNTCEIASVPYLPVMDLIAEHIGNLVPSRLDGMMIGWTQGGYPSPNFQLVRDMNQNPMSSGSSILDSLARDRFGLAGWAHARQGWRLMSEAFRQYPFHVSVVYSAPVQIGPANPLYPEHTGYRATMWGIPYDDLDTWRGPYPSEVFIAQFERMSAGWRAGVAELRSAVQKAPRDRRSEAASDLRFARAAGIIFQSTANQARFVLARSALSAPPGTVSSERLQRLRGEMRRIVKSEIALARELFLIASEDSRIGFEPSCQYFYLPGDLLEKVINCRWVLDHMPGPQPAPAATAAAR